MCPPMMLLMGLQQQVSACLALQKLILELYVAAYHLS